jgi:hypothetical protein
MSRPKSSKGLNLMLTKEDFPDYETVEYHLVYSELIAAARKRGTVTYQELAHVVGLPLSGSHMGKRIGQLLGAVSWNEVQQGRPMLSAIAVNVRGDAGDGFFELAQNYFNLMRVDEDKQAFWESQRDKCYQIWKQQFPKK